VRINLREALDLLTSDDDRYTKEGDVTFNTVSLT